MGKERLAVIIYNLIVYIDDITQDQDVTIDILRNEIGMTNEEIDFLFNMFE